MAKKESTFFNMVSTLLVVTFIASLSLAGVYALTKEPIELSKMRKKQEAIEMVLPAFDKLETFDVQAIDGGEVLEFNLALNKGDTVGVAIVTYTYSGFSGRIRAMVGVLNDGSLHDVVHLEHKETPGLGDKIEKSKSTWSDQFKSLSQSDFPLAVKKDGGNVDGITAATITARAYCDAINRAYDTYLKWRADNNE